MAHTARSYDLETGELIWSCGGQVSNPIPTPVVRDGVAFCMTGYRGNAAFAISLDAEGDATGTDSIHWSRDDAAPYVASPVLYKGHLYFTKSLGNILTSVNVNTGANRDGADQDRWNQHDLCIACRRRRSHLYHQPAGHDGRDPSRGRA